MTAGQLGSLLPIVLIVLAFWFLILRPARKRQVQAQRLQDQIAVGERVMLTSGIFGHVVEMDDETLQLEVAPGVVITALRPAVARLAPLAEEAGSTDTIDTTDTTEADRTATERTDGKDAPA